MTEGGDPAAYPARASHLDAVIRTSTYRSAESGPIKMGLLEVQDDIHLRLWEGVGPRNARTAPDAPSGALIEGLPLTVDVCREWVLHCRESESAARPVRFEYTQEEGSRSRQMRVTVQFLSHGVTGRPRCSYLVEEVTPKEPSNTFPYSNAGHPRYDLSGVVRALTFAVEARDPYTARHQLRVASLAAGIARVMGKSAEEIEVIHVAGLLHDIGKIAVPSEIMNRAGQLNPAERTIVQSHVQVGYDILRGIDFDGPIALVALQHHERLDGSGYPLQLKREDILPEACLMAVADVVEAMLSHRPYRPALSMEQTLNEIVLHRTRLFDAVAVDACMTLMREYDFDFEDLERSEQAAWEARHRTI